MAAQRAALPADLRSITPKTLPTLRAVLTKARSLGPDGTGPPPANTEGAPPGEPPTLPPAAAGRSPRVLTAGQGRGEDQPANLSQELNTLPEEDFGLRPVFKIPAKLNR